MSTAGPAHRVQSAVVEYGYPQGHLGHLTPDEEAAFENFKLVCAEKKLYTPATAGQQATHEDATLLRFLRARHFVVADALNQFSHTETWRKANQLDQLYETIDLDEYEETRRLYPQWTGRRDRRGIPVYVFEVKHLNSKTMSAYEKSAKETHSKATSTDGKTPPKMMRLFALYENLIRFTMPLCTAQTDREHPRTPITQSNNIVDISGVGLKQFWNLRSHMQDASTLATAHYPETLDRIFVIGAPAFFPTVWGWIKKWFDPITTSKIFILSSHDMQKTLESFIEPGNIPKKYGGQLDFKFGDMPIFDPKLQKILQWENGNKDFPHGPMWWVDGEKDGDDETILALAGGSKGGKERKERVCTVTKTLQTNRSLEAVGVHKAAETNGVRAPASAIRPELLSAPTATPSEVDLVEQSAASSPQSPLAATDATPESAAVMAAEAQTVEQGHDGRIVVQDGEIVPASRPEPSRFVTAEDGLATMSLDGKPGHMVNGNAAALPNGDVKLNGSAGGPHTTATANLLDPAVDRVAVSNGVAE